MKTDTIKHYFSRRLFVRAVYILWICFVLLLGAMPLSAQVYSTSQYGARYDARQDAQYGAQYNGYGTQEEMQPTYNPYQSTVYQPFGSSLPSESNPVYSNAQGGSDRNNAPSNRRNVGGVEIDPGNQSELSPVGEAWVMLLFAAVAAAVVFVRQRKAAVRG